MQAASTAAMTTGRYSGLQPAMTALMATFFSTVAGARLGGYVCHHVARLPRGAGQHPRDPFLGRRHHRQAVGQALPGRGTRTDREDAGMRTRRAASFEASRLAASRRATSGSWTFEPQPGRVSGNFSPSRSITGAAAAATLCREADQRPADRPCRIPRSSPGLSPPRRPARARGPRRSRYASETSSSSSSARGSVSPWRSANAAGARRVVLRHAEHAEAGPGQRPVHPLDQRCGQLARRAVVLEEEEQRGGRSRAFGAEPAGIAGRRPRSVNEAAFVPGVGSVDMATPSIR